jgi:hypothetical protein
MLRLEAPRDIPMITSGSEPTEETVEIAKPASWIRSLAHQQEQAAQDLRQLYEACGNQFDPNDQRYRNIEKAYTALYNGCRYVYTQAQANSKIPEAWIRSELAVAANAYQTFSRQVWQGIIDHTQEAGLRQAHQATQLARLHDALAFLTETNVARNTHLATFQGNVETWAGEQQAKVSRLEQELKSAQDEIKRVAASVPPSRLREASPEPPTFLQGLPDAPTVAVRNPIPLIPGLPEEGSGGGQSSRPLQPLQPDTSDDDDDGDDDDLYTVPPQQKLLARQNDPPTVDMTAIARLIGEGIAAAQPASKAQEQPDGRIGTARLKMKNPESFDGAATARFSRWWESVVMFLGFYPNTTDRQKIAWVGSLLTDTALSWHLYRYRELGDTDTWANYSAAIRGEYHDTREAADAQLKLGQLKYQGSIRAYLTDFRTLNVYARATGESLQEKINMAMPDSILDMRFNQNEEDFVDDEHFLRATYKAGLQVEKKKALKAAKEAIRSGGHPKEDKDTKGGQGTGKGSGKDRRAQEGKTETTHKEPKGATSGGKAAKPGNGKKSVWGSTKEALKGVAQEEIDAHKKGNKEGCYRCGQKGHFTTDCYAKATLKGTPLPAAPSAGITASACQGKRKRADTDIDVDPPIKQEVPEPKQTTTSAARTEDLDMKDLPVWAEESDESDF